MTQVDVGGAELYVPPLQLDAIAEAQRSSAADESQDSGEERFRDISTISDGNDDGGEKWQRISIRVAGRRVASR